MMLRLVLAAFVMAPALAPAASLSTNVEFGWTSNAEGAAGGTSDTYVEQRHTLGFDHEGEGFVLRGAVFFGETRYSRLWQKSEQNAGAEIAGEWQIAPETLARASLALGWHKEGQAIPLGPELLAAWTPSLKGSIDIELETRMGGTTLAAGLGYSARAYGDTQFDRLVLPARTRADTNVANAHLRLSHSLTENLALTGLAQGIVQMITEADQIAYGRIPVRILRFAAGIDIKIPLRAAFVLEAGSDIVWAGDTGLDPAILPYARSEMTLALGGGVELFGRMRTSVDFETPADGFADWIITGQAGIGYIIAQTARLEALVTSAAKRSIGFDVEHERSLGGEISAQLALSNAIAARIGLSHTHHWGLAGAFEETRLGLTFQASI